MSGVVSTSCHKCGAALPAGNTVSLCAPCLFASALTPPEPESLGTLGDFELLEEVARGGMGVVYRARQRSLNRLCAVKVLAAGSHARDEFVRRFRIEAEAAAQLSHPNMVAIYAVGEADGRPFMAMEYISGANLALWRSTHDPTPDESARLVHLLAEAVHFAHQRGILHRDLKPQNVLMDEAGRPRLTDFGLAKLVEGARDLTITGAGFGSPGYAAPEQACGRHAAVGPHSDVYSLGAILYFLLTRRAPHVGENALETFRRSLEEVPVPPGRIAHGVPRDLETICLKCLEKDPGRRYSSARSLAEDLGRFLDRMPLQARRAGPVWHTWLWARSRPWTITGLASLLQLAMIGIAYGLWQETRCLRWQLAHPGLPLPSGRLLVFSPAHASLAIYVCMLSGYLPLKDLRLRMASGCALERGDVIRGSSLGAIFASAGILLLIGCLDGFVWRYEHAWSLPWLALLAPFSFFWFGSIIALKALRGYHADRNAADVLAAQLGSPIRSSPARFLGTLLAALLVLVPVTWTLLGADEGHRFLYLLTNIVLLLLGLSLWRAARDEMRSFWQFLATAMSALALELSLTLAPSSVLSALLAGGAVAVMVVWRARIALRPGPLTS